MALVEDHGVASVTNFAMSNMGNMGVMNGTVATPLSNNSSSSMQQVAVAPVTVHNDVPVFLPPQRIYDAFLKIVWAWLPWLAWLFR